MIVTLDAALAVNEDSERDMLDRIRDKVQHRPLLPQRDLDRRRRAIVAIHRKAGFPEPVSVAEIASLLIAHGII